jgi:hypothetical protein
MDLQIHIFGLLQKKINWGSPLLNTHHSIYLENNKNILKIKIFNQLDRITMGIIAYKIFLPFKNNFNSLNITANCKSHVWSFFIQ